MQTIKIPTHTTVFNLNDLKKLDEDDLQELIVFFIEKKEEVMPLMAKSKRVISEIESLPQLSANLMTKHHILSKFTLAKLELNYNFLSYIANILEEELKTR